MWFLFHSRSGSVIADYTIIATSNSLDFVAANIEVSDSLSTQGLNVTKDDLILSGKGSQCLI